MSKEKYQEMAKVLIDYTKKNNIMASHVILEDYAEHLYDAGYRKQSENATDINVGDKVEWISVDERLPEKYKDVLCYGNGHSFFVDFICSDGTWCDDHIDKITHWIPLPEAPKMRKEDEGK